MIGASKQDDEKIQQRKMQALLNALNMIEFDREVAMDEVKWLREANNRYVVKTIDKIYEQNNTNTNNTTTNNSNNNNNSSSSNNKNNDNLDKKTQPLNPVIDLYKQVKEREIERERGRKEEETKEKEEKESKEEVLERGIEVVDYMQEQFIVSSRELLSTVMASIQNHLSSNNVQLLFPWAGRKKNRLMKWVQSCGFSVCHQGVYYSSLLLMNHLLIILIIESTNRTLLC